MADVVVDTDIASYIFNQHRLAPYYVELLRGRNLLLSFMSVAELPAGAFAANRSDRRRLELDEYIAEFHVVYSENDTCTNWARVRAEARRAGRGLSAQDAWIAATALSIDAPLATNNRRDFEHIRQLQLLSS